MKISVITVSLNSVKTIEDTICSIAAQTWPNIEHILIDGGSTDGTVHVLQRHSNKLTRWVSEPDHGLYDAMNKGIAMATGDVVGILNADDVYADRDVLRTVAKILADEKWDACYADLVYVDHDNLDRVVRIYRSDTFHIGKFAWGWMPAHPTFFVKRFAYEKYGYFKTDYKIAADYELVMRFLYKHKLSHIYMPRTIVKMRTGGVSTRNLWSNWILNKEIVRACAENGVKTNLLKVISKYPSKIFQLVRR